MPAFDRYFCTYSGQEADADCSEVVLNGETRRSKLCFTRRIEALRGQVFNETVERLAFKCPDCESVMLTD